MTDATGQGAGIGFDDLDQRIVDLLRRDGRRSITEVARAAGVTKQTIAKRLERLLERKAIRISALVDPVALGFPLFWSIGVRAKPGARERVAEHLAAMEEVAWVGYSTGGFDIMLEVFLPDTDAVFEFLNERLAEMPDVVTTREWLVLRSAKYEYLWEDDGTAGITGGPAAAVARDGGDRRRVRGWTAEPGAGRELVRLDDLDRAIVGLLREDGRRSFADIARRTGVAEGTVANRVDRLTQTGAMLVVARVDWPSVGYRVHVYVGVKASRGRIAQVGERLAGQPRVSYVGYTTGDFDILVEAFLADSAGLLEFLDVDVASIPGVESIETWHVLRVIKVNCEWEGERIGRMPPASR